jgi:hypothetical protein
MNIKTLFGKRNEIIGGHFNELRSKLGMANQDEEVVFSVREEICNACPLKTETTAIPKNGFILRLWKFQTVRKTAL